MSQLNNPVEIFKLLNKTNCRDCGSATCLAFAAAVFKGQKRLNECPHLGRRIIIFNGRQVENHYESDISLVLHPLPLVPILICYWNPEDELESDLHIFFDETAEKNLPIESIYSLCAGLVTMFEKIFLKHGLK